MDMQHKRLLRRCIVGSATGALGGEISAPRVKVTVGILKNLPSNSASKQIFP